MSPRDPFEPAQRTESRRLERRRRLPGLVAATATLLALSPAALAQQVAVPPDPHTTEHYPVFVGYIFMFLFVVIIVGVSLMPSKRAHQD